MPAPGFISGLENKNYKNSLPSKVGSSSMKNIAHVENDDSC